MEVDGWMSGWIWFKAMVETGRYNRRKKYKEETETALKQYHNQQQPANQPDKKICFQRSISISPHRRNKSLIEHVWNT